MQKKKLFFAGIILCLLIITTGAYLYQKPRSGLSNVKPAYTLSAKELYRAFEQNEKNANQQFVEKVIKVKGTVENVQSTDSALNILLSAGETGGINCSLAKVSNTGSQIYTKGTVIEVKGRCIGFLMDVNLVDAVIEP